MATCCTAYRVRVVANCALVLPARVRTPDSDAITAVVPALSPVVVGYKPHASGGQPWHGATTSMAGKARRWDQHLPLTWVGWRAPVNTPVPPAP